VEIDYRSLGAPEISHDKNSKVIANWQLVLPGFDKTKHVVTNHKITINGD